MPRGAGLCVVVGLSALFCAAEAQSGAERWPMVRVDVVGMPRGLRAVPGVFAGDTVEDEEIEQGRRAVEQRLYEEGFLRPDVRVETLQVRSGLAVRYVVEPGARSRIAGWRVTGDGSVAGRPAQAYLPGRGAIFSKRNLERASLGLLTALERHGFPLAEVAPAGVEDSGGWVIPALAVRAGPRVVVSRLEFRGAEDLPRRLLVRLARFQPGRTYSAALVRFWQTGLEQSGAVRALGHEIVTKPSPAVRFAVAPTRSSRAFAAVGYETERRAFTGFAELNLRNMLNTGRSAQAGWRAFSRRSSWSLRYVEPWVLVYWLGLEASARHEVYDTSAAYTSLALRADIASGQGPVVELSAGYDFAAAADTTGTEASRTVWAGTGLRVDTREPAAFARRGSFLGLRTTAGNRTGSAGSRFVGRFELDAVVYGPSVGPLVPVNAGHYRLAYSRVPLTVPEQYRMGGARTLRGYQEEEFTGAQLGWLNCELHWQLGRDAVGYPFLDVGLCETRSGWGAGLGYGLGLRAATAIGTVEAAYGIGYRDDPLRGKVHLGFQAEF